MNKEAKWHAAGVNARRCDKRRQESGVQQGQIARTSLIELDIQSKNHVSCQLSSRESLASVDLTVFLMLFFTTCMGPVVHLNCCVRLRTAHRQQD